MKTLTELYEELEQLKNNNLACDISYITSNIINDKLPYVYTEIISIKFPESIAADRVSKVRDYIEREYGKTGNPVEKAELRSAHTLRLHIIKTSTIPITTKKIRL